MMPTDLQDALYPLQLIDTRLYEASIKRPQASEEERPEESIEAGPSLEISLDIREQPPRQLVARLSVGVRWPSADSPELEICLSLEGLFEATEGLENLGEERLAEFRQGVAYGLLWPYARECLHSLTRRTRVEVPPLPTLNVLALAQLQAERQGEAEEEAGKSASPDGV